VTLLLQQANGQKLIDEVCPPPAEMTTPRGIAALTGGGKHHQGAARQDFNSRFTTLFSRIAQGLVEAALQSSMRPSRPEEEEPKEEEPTEAAHKFLKKRPDQETILRLPN
jgi:hypothetical protein